MSLPSLLRHVGIDANEVTVDGEVVERLKEAKRQPLQVLPQQNLEPLQGLQEPVRVEIVEGQLLRLQPGDMLAVRLPDGFTVQERAWLARTARDTLDAAGHQDVTVLMLPYDSEVSVVRPEREPPPQDTSWLEFARP